MSAQRAGALRRRYPEAASPTAAPALADVPRRVSARQGVSRLTQRGLGLTITAVVLVPCAYIFGVEELYAVAAAILALVVVALAWAASGGWEVAVSRRLQPARVESGHRVSVSLTIYNRSPRQTPLLRFVDPLDDGPRTTELLVAPLPPSRRLSTTYDLPPLERGVYQVGPCLVEATDPLGLARQVRRGTSAATLIVHPPIERLRPPRVGPGSDRAPGRNLPIPGSTNEEFAALREYSPGDDIRRLHWASSARLGTLMIREDQVERRGLLVVLLDLRRSMWSSTSLERAVSVAASVTTAALDAGLAVRLLTTAGADTATPGRGGRPSPAWLPSRPAGVPGVGGGYRPARPDDGAGPGSRRRWQDPNGLAGNGGQAAAEGGYWSQLGDGGGPTGTEQLRARCMDVLAEARVHGPREGNGWPLRLPAGGTVVVVSSDLAQSEDVKTVSHLARRSELVFVVIEEPRRGGRRGPLSAGLSALGGEGRNPSKLLHLPVDAALAPIWDRLA